MGRWTVIAATGGFDFDNKSVTQHWARLHACDMEPLPSQPEFLEAWALFHSGHFEKAHHAGLGLGTAGSTVANKAACIYANQLAPDEGERLALYQAVSESAAAHALSEPSNPNAHFLLAYSLGRYGQSISVAKGLAQGLGSKIKTALETTLALQPLHADAHFALGTFHADIIDKVGPLIGSMTYGAKKEVSLHLFAQGFKLLPRSPTGLMDYAMALLMLEGEDRQDEATALYRYAAAQKPADAQEHLDIALAKTGINA